MSHNNTKSSTGATTTGATAASIGRKKPGIRLLGPKIALGLTSAITIGAVVYSHYSQVQDRAAMKEGVKRDKERIRMKRLMKKQQRQQQQEQQQLNEGGKLHVKDENR
jgi:hypothetical protein